MCGRARSYSMLFLVKFQCTPYPKIVSSLALRLLACLINCTRSLPAKKYSQAINYVDH